MEKVRQKVTYLSNDNVVCNHSFAWLHSSGPVEIGNCCPKLQYFYIYIMPNYLFSIKSISFKLSNPAESQKSNGIRENLPRGVFPVAYLLLFPRGARPAFPNLSFVICDWFTYWLSLPVGICGCDFNWKCQSVPQHSTGPSVFRNRFVLNEAESQNFICEWSAFWHIQPSLCFNGFVWFCASCPVKIY